MARDTEGKPVPSDAFKQHHGLATGKAADTGAGKGATETKERPSTRW